MAVAGIAINKNAVPEIVRTLAEIKRPFPKPGEVKWSNAKSFGGKVHRLYINYLFDLIRAGRAHFHIRFSPMNEYDHSLSGARKRIDTVSRAFYQLILHRAVRFYGNKCDINVYPDDGECTERLPEFIAALGNDERRLFQRNNRSSVNLIQPRCSATEPLLQLLDVTLGALSAYRNRRDLVTGASLIKRNLAHHAFSMTGWPDITGNCWQRDIKLNRWNVTPKFERGR